MEIRNLQDLCEKTENPRVGGSIPPQATSKPFDNTRGFWFSVITSELRLKSSYFSENVTKTSQVIYVFLVHKPMD